MVSPFVCDGTAGRAVRLLIDPVRWADEEEGSKNTASGVHQLMTLRFGSLRFGFLVALAPTVAFGHDCAAAAQPGAIGGQVFERVDGNGDGVVQLAEAEAVALARFEQADADRDGVVRRDEAELWARAERVRRLEERFERLDIDRDGVVGAREMAGRKRGFARFDLDRDGSVTREELRRASGREPPLGHGRSWLGRFETWDVDADGGVRRTEVQHQVSRHFRESDANRDGVLSRSEVRGRRRTPP